MVKAFGSCCKVSVAWLSGLAARGGNFSCMLTALRYPTRHLSYTCSRMSQDSSMKTTQLDVEGWTGRWQERNIGFHKTHVHPLLRKHVDKLLGGKPAQRVFVPLCGKSLDMKWLSDAGHTVVGVEGAEQAILEFFSEQNRDYSKEPLSELDGDVFKSKDERIIIYRCDFFEFARCKEKDFHAVWDRGSMVAVNTDQREKYSDVIKSVVSNRSKILLCIVDYTKDIWPGPPHLMAVDEVKQIFGETFDLEIVERQDAMEERWSEKGITEFEEIAILLSHKKRD